MDGRVRPGDAVPRYRLRFLLQEIDLPPGETILGRSASCHVTIEDPLVSRQHGCILVDGARASIRDMGSRNGLTVNARQIPGPTELKDGDRIRIGTQEMVFCAVRAQSRPGVGPGSRPTGFMCHCAHCGLPYPAELILCPACGSRERMDEDTISGVVGEADKNWTLELLVDVLDKAVSLERWDDVERMLSRSRGNVEERLRSGAGLSSDHLDRLAEAAATLAKERREADWGRWILAIYANLGAVPADNVIERLITLPATERATLVPAASRVVAQATGRGGLTEVETASLARVQLLTQSSGGSGG